MGKLDRAVAYLSGAMEMVTFNEATEWRRKFVKLIKESNLKIDCIDPTNKPGDSFLGNDEDKDHQSKLQREGRWVELQNYVRSYRRADLRFVDLSDFLVAVINPRVPQWGTSNEIYEAERQHKPIFFIIDGGLAKLPRWLFPVIELTDYHKGTRCNVFESVEQVIEELKMLNEGQIHLNDEWVLVRKHIEVSRYYDQQFESSLVALVAQYESEPKQEIMEAINKLVASRFRSQTDAS